MHAEYAFNDGWHSPVHFFLELTLLLIEQLLHDLRRRDIEAVEILPIADTPRSYHKAMTDTGQFDAVRLIYTCLCHAVRFATLFHFRIRKDFIFSRSMPIILDFVSRFRFGARIVILLLGYRSLIRFYRFCDTILLRFLFSRSSRASAPWPHAFFAIHLDEADMLPIGPDDNWCCFFLEITVSSLWNDGTNAFSPCEYFRIVSACLHARHYALPWSFRWWHYTVNF